MLRDANEIQSHWHMGTLNHTHIKSGFAAFLPPAVLSPKNQYKSG